MRADGFNKQTVSLGTHSRSVFKVIYNVRFNWLHIIEILPLISFLILFYWNRLWITSMHLSI